jgi:hypothetical protein
MDRINANVFREMKNAKHGKKVNDIYAPKNKPPDKKNSSNQQENTSFSMTSQDITTTNHLQTIN